MSPGFGNIWSRPETFANSTNKFFGVKGFFLFGIAVEWDFSELFGQLGCEVFVFTFQVALRQGGQNRDQGVIGCFSGFDVGTLLYNIDKFCRLHSILLPENIQSEYSSPET